jgi:hypothetical protein
VPDQGLSVNDLLDLTDMLTPGDDPGERRGDTVVIALGDVRAHCRTGLITRSPSDQNRLMEGSMPLTVREMIPLIERDGWFPGEDEREPPAVQARHEAGQGHDCG